MSARNRELFGLVLVAMVTCTGFASVYLAHHSQISAVSFTNVAFFLGLYLVAHIVTRMAVPHADPYLLPMAALLTAIGLTFIYRLQPSDAFRQGLWIAIAIGVFCATLMLLRHDYRRLESYKYLFGLGAIGMLFLPLLPVIGQTVNGARLWIHFGSLQFQPGEVGKILLIVFLAAYLREKREVLTQGRLKDVGPLLLIWGIAMLILLATKDLGSALLYFGIFLGMLYAATSRLLYVGAGLALFVGGCVFVYRTTAHVRDRVTIWLHPWTSHPVPCPIGPHHTPELRQNCLSYQLVKSLYSIANGGIGGTGLGKGTFTLANGKTPLIPGAKTDFIYSIPAQELGLVGIVAFLLIFMMFAARGFRVALLADDGFSKLVAAGLTFGFALQTFIIVGGVLRLIPLTGITLPYVSYGGSSVVANFILLAGLLLISNRAEAESMAPELEEEWP
ncbi:MAG: FtsW/RodA/SpoVE family cell cycle protein [Gaiellaceae bacterium]